MALYLIMCNTKAAKLSVLVRLLSDSGRRVSSQKADGNRHIVTCGSTSACFSLYLIINVHQGLQDGVFCV